MISREGTRPLLVEVQALVDDAQGQPRRVALGLEQNRLNMLLAVMHRHGGVQTTGQDVYVNIVGGLKLPKQVRTWLFYLHVLRVYEQKPYLSSLQFLVKLGSQVKSALYLMVRNV